MKKMLDIANQIGENIADQAIWQGDACTWKVSVPDPAHSDKPSTVHEAAPGNVYQGTAGIAWFLAELYQHTEDEVIKETANGALQHALSYADGLSEYSFGFYNGRVGVAYVAARLGKYFGRPQYLDRATDLLTPLVGNAEKEIELEVIGGAAGAIPALLQLAELLDSDREGQLAVNLGEVIIQRAFHEPVGWSWSPLDSTGATRMRHLTGYAHGASGVGHSLLELHDATGADRYRYAAEQAFLYERQFFDEARSNWPDFRYSEASKHLADGKDKLKEVIHNNELPAAEKTYMSFWCHGAPGIGLVRLRAYEISGNDTHLGEAQAALDHTKRTLNSILNYSLCHGRAGNCEALLHGASVLNEPSLLERAVDCGRQGSMFVQNDGKSWPCGTSDGSSDPSLMLGEAGIGYFYLRLFSRDTPSCLFLRAPNNLDLEVKSESGYQALQRDYVQSYFDQTLRVLDTWELNSPFVLERSIAKSMHQSDVEWFNEQLENCLSQLGEPDRSMLKDAVRPERVRLRMQKDIDDFTEETMNRLRYPDDIDNISWNNVTFKLAPNTQLVECRWSWEDWLKTPPHSRPDTPNSEKEAILVYYVNKLVRIQKLDPFAEIVIKIIDKYDKYISIKKTVKKIKKITGLGDKNNNSLKNKTRDQVKKFYEGGILRLG